MRIAICALMVLSGALPSTGYTYMKNCAEWINIGPVDPITKTLPLSKAEKEVQATLDRHKARVQKRYGAVPMVEGARMFDDNVSLLILGFEVDGPFSLERMRLLMVDTVTSLLHDINSNERLRPYLDHYPMEGEGVRVTFTTSIEPQPDGSNIAYATSEGNRLFYVPIDAYREGGPEYEIAEDLTSAFLRLRDAADQMAQPLATTE
jgi:hypothetical protein